MTNTTEENTKAVQGVVEVIASMIHPEAFDGSSENGRLDAAEAYDKAEDILSELFHEHLSELVKDRFIKEAAPAGHYVIDKQQMSVLKQVAKTNKKIHEVVDDLKHSQLDTYIDNVDFLYEVEFEPKRYNTL